MALIYRLTCVLLLVLFACVGEGAESMLVPKSLSAAARESFSVYLLRINEGQSERTLETPATLEGQLHRGTTMSAKVVLSLQGPQPPSVLAPGAFSKAEYRFVIPEGTFGPAVLDIPASGAPPVMISVLAVEQAEAANKGQPANETERKQRNTALRRTTRLLPGLSAHEPVYFGAGLQGGASAKFQISLKYNPFDQWPVYVGYTQTSIWDLHSTSKPFRDSAYRPSLFLHRQTLWSSPGTAFALGAQGGFEHESNGRAGAESRTINILFLRPRLEWRLSAKTMLFLSPKIYGYVDKEENPDIGDYRGYVDLRLGVTHNDFRLSTTLRKGARDRYGSVLVEAVFPLRSTDAFIQRLGVDGMNGYLFAQYFCGWGESILDYRRKLPSQLRAGFMIVP